MSQSDESKTGGELFISSADYFRDVVDRAVEDRRLETPALARHYLSNLLVEYVPTEKLFDESDENGRKRRETLALLYLRAGQAPESSRNELYKKLGDVSLYVSGFFSDSLRRKVIDVDYYVEMGGAAYATLASRIEDELYSRIYADFSRRFSDYVDVLTVISRTSFAQGGDLLRLYELYMATGSKLAEEELAAKNLLNAQVSPVKPGRQ